MISSGADRLAFEFAGTIELYGCRNRMLIRLETGDYVQAQELCQQAHSEAERHMNRLEHGPEFLCHFRNSRKILELEAMIAAAALNAWREGQATVADC